MCADPPTHTRGVSPDCEDVKAGASARAPMIGGFRLLRFQPRGLTGPGALVPAYCCCLATKKKKAPGPLLPPSIRWVGCVCTAGQLGGGTSFLSPGENPCLVVWGRRAKPQGCTRDVGQQSSRCCGCAGPPRRLTGAHPGADPCQCPACLQSLPPPPPSSSPFLLPTPPLPPQAAPGEASSP